MSIENIVLAALGAQIDPLKIENVPEGLQTAPFLYRILLLQLQSIEHALARVSSISWVSRVVEETTREQGLRHLEVSDGQGTRIYITNGNKQLSKRENLGATGQSKGAAQLLGSGAFGSVYAHRTDPSLCVKKIRVGSGRHEFKVAQVLSHPHLARHECLLVKITVPFAGRKEGSVNHKLVMERVM